jgi:putative hydrolase of the HAD superfamily
VSNAHADRDGGSPLRDPFGNIRAVTLDVGSTLIEPRPSVGHVYASVAARYGHPGLSPDLLNERFQMAFGARSGPLHRSVDWESVVDQTFQDLVEPLPSRSFFAALYREFSEPGTWRIYEDVIPALVGLRARRMPLAIVSNWDDRLRPLLVSLDLARHFEHIVISCEVGVSKPHPAIFQRAAQLLQLPVASILHVGDHLQEDVAGARQAGFHGLLLQRNQPPSPGNRIAALTALL